MSSVILRRPVVEEARRAVDDVAVLLRFRVASLRVRGRRAAAVALTVMLGLTALAVVVPAYVPAAATSERAGEIAALLPSAYVAFLVATTVAISVAGGGRELLSREEGVAFPVSPTTDHLGALLMAPMNMAWLMQAWAIVGATAFVVGPAGLVAAQLTVLAWLLAATAAAQALAWGVEWVRRGPRGLLTVRLVTAAAALSVAGLVTTGNLTAVLDRSPTLDVVRVALSATSSGSRVHWAVGTLVIVIAGLASVVLGALVAHAVSRRAPREQVRGEGRTFAPRSAPRSDHATLVRVDRGSMWRSVPLRRGLITLTLLPAAVMASGQVDWYLLPILPGIVAAGGALLFGVNAWCLDGTGALWRDSLPVRPAVAFVARSRMLVEVLLVATVLPLLVAGVRAGDPPTSAEAVSVLCTVVVVTLQVVARAMHWSVRRPHGVDLRSARGAPAPPLAMVSYSAYMSLTSTLTGLLFVLTSQADSPKWAVLVALPLVLLAVRRLVATAGEWARPDVRARVVATVASR